MSLTRGFTRRILLNTAATITTGVWSVVLGVGSTAVLLSQLGLVTFGLFALIQSFSVVAGWASTFTNGLAVASTRRMSAVDLAPAHNPQTTSLRSLRSIARAGDRPWEPAVTIIIATGFLVGGVFALGAPLLPYAINGLEAADRTPTTTGFRWFALLVVAEACFIAVSSTFEGLQRLDISRGIDASRRTVTVGVAVAVSLVSPQLETVLAGQAIAATLSAILLLGVTGLFPRSFPKTSDVSAYLAEAAGPAIINASGVLHRTMDRAIVAAMLGPATVAIVEVATRLQDVVRLVLSATSQATMSAAPWLRSRGAEDQLSGLVRTATRLTTGLTLIAAATLLALRYPILEAWTDADTARAAAPLLVVGLLYLAIEAPFQVIGNVMIGLGQFRRLAISFWIAVGVNLLATIWLVSQLGAVGAFAGTLAGTVVIIGVLAPELFSVTGHTPGQAIRSLVGPALPPALAAFGAAAFVTWLDLDLWLTIVLGLIAAGCASVAVSWFGLFDADERRRISSALSGPSSAAVAEDDRPERSDEDLHIKQQ